MAKNKDKREDGFSEVESTLTRTEQLIEDNQKMLTTVIGVIVLIVVAYLGFTRMYIQPRELDAQEQMFMAEQYFEKDSFNLAINGDGNYLGFLDIIDDYGMTNAANLASYYTGISFLKLGEYEAAIEYLNDFTTDDLLLVPVAEGAKGDAYQELGETDKALAAYKKAYTSSANEFTTPIYMMKAANLMEAEGRLQEALALYESIKEKYPATNEGRNVEKYIARVELKQNK
ncbi:tetratricopeptide repeat protein [uncultured Sunxiuqinia sp.]|jgi:tetratricopeptide (TPR) repeat protein|uniref:tetratricopeptide repeat protein n=1 Tax=uncultured Sunxiuqinia sp. TaxID=1573825 RepID=UPI0019B76673|nr:tetratricopeptide repeat protein [Sunxiuqinia sp.]|tara:strand:+ start:173 stop:862 length:690 start_codon:yes stop_codon:yes gene_type:complete